MAETRSSHAQIEAMRRLHPRLVGERRGDGRVIWVGPVQPRQKTYVIGVEWWPGRIDRPYVVVLKPTIRPRDGGAFDDIPHLMFDAEQPELSGLCLFDPDGREWTPSDLIAETTIPWACEWLHYYELWRMTGEWLGPSAGFHTVKEMREARTSALIEASRDVH